MNIIEKLPLFISFYDALYQLRIYPNAWGNLTITYGKIDNMIDHLFSVCVEKDHPIRRIEDTIDTCFNDHIGNAPSFDEAAQLILDYLEYNKNFIKIED